MTSFGQASTQSAQPLHRSVLTTMAPLNFPILICCYVFIGADGIMVVSANCCLLSGVVNVFAIVSKDVVEHLLGMDRWRVGVAVDGVLPVAALSVLVAFAVIMVGSQWVAVAYVLSIIADFFVHLLDVFAHLLDVLACLAVCSLLVKLVLASRQCVLHERADGHGTNAARHGCDE